MSIQLPEVKRGTFLVIRANGNEEDHKLANTTQIRREIGAEVLDTVNLTFKLVMLVDDTGMIDGRPINQKATDLYHAKCVPGTTWPICGDVAIANDEDFG